MGIFEIIGRTIGTATLITCGTASAVLKGISDTIGFELGSELFGAVKDAGFSGVRSLWEDRDIECIDTIETLDYTVENATRHQMARTAKQAANIAKKNGDMEKYEYYTNQYEMYKD